MDIGLPSTGGFIAKCTLNDLLLINNCLMLAYAHKEFCHIASSIYL